MNGKKEKFVSKKILSNGMAVLVKETHNVPKVSMQLFYNVGSKDEKTGEKGIAHLIEHMVFKGTEKLSETDITAITHMLSGACNAFTSSDYTGYLFNIPSQNWKEILPVFAECMTSCTFKDDHLNSEMKTVIQELKMRKDRFFNQLFVDMLSAIFSDHPYHYPVIGYKQDLWNVRGDDLRKFYKKHYVPNNATLVVVGDVDTDEVFDLCQKTFGQIEPDKNYKKEKFYFNTDISSKSVTLYRDVKQPFMMLSFVVPGVSKKNEHIFDAAELILGKGKSSRLHKKLVNQLQLVTSLGADAARMFDHSLFFIWFEPKDVKDIEKIKAVIFDEINNIIENGLSKKEIEGAIKQSKMAYYSNLENIEKQAYDIGYYFLATGDEDYAFEYLDGLDKDFESEIKNLLSQYFRPAVMHQGIVLPFDKKERVQWNRLQEISDKQDAEILSARIRETTIEPPEYAKNIKVGLSQKFSFPKAKKFDISNGIKVFYYDNRNTPKIDLVLELRAKYFYDPEDKQGLYNFVSAMMTEGTKKYTAEQLADEIESRGMSLSISSGVVTMSMLKDDLAKGLELLQEILSNPRFDEKEIEKVRQQIFTEIKNFWDDPNSISARLLRENIYKGHPYSKNGLGTKESVEKITRQDLIDFHEKYVSPNGARLSIVGDLSNCDVKTVLQENFVKWQGPEVTEYDFPKIPETKKELLNYYINRDQVYLSFAKLSIARKNKDYDKFMLFDQIFGGGALGSMHSKLFQLREQTGLFYTIFGSLVANAGLQPGMFLVRTIVSLDQLKEAQTLIARTIDTVLPTINEIDLVEAKRAIINSLLDKFDSNKKIAATFIFLDKYDFPLDYFDNRGEQLEKINLAEVKDAVKNILHAENMLVLNVGRV